MSIVNYLSVDFDVSPRIIWIDTALSTSISVQNLIDTCGYLSAQQANMDDDILLESSGKEYLVADGSVKVGLTVTLNNCKIGFQSLGGPDWILCSIEGGNTVSVEDIYVSPRVYIDVIHPTAYISVERVSSSSATLSELTAIQYASFGGGVTIDVINGVEGTDFPIGTIESPSNNISDSAVIANKRGFNKLFIKGDITLSDTTNLEKYTIQGESIVKSKIIIEPIALVFGTEFTDATIAGTLDGNNTAHHCAIQTLKYVQGHIHDCLLEEYTITLSGISETAFLNCWSSGAAQDTTPIIDMGGAGKTLIIRGHSGGIRLVNKSGPEDATLDFESGRVILDDTVTAGNVTIRGIGQVEDNSTGTTVVDVSGVMSKKTITEISWDTVYIDTMNGCSGTAFPIGTSSKPSSNISDAITIADDNSIKTFKIRGAVDLPQTFEDWTFIGVGSLFSDVINLNNQNINRCRFETLTASGTLTTTYTHFTRCKLLNVSGLSGLLIDSALQGNITMGGPGSVLTGQNIGVYGNTPGAPAVLNVVGAGRIFQASLDGAIQFSNVDVGSYIEVGLKNGIVIIDPTCTGGTASFTGVGNLINYSAMTVYSTLLTEFSIADTVWDETSMDHTVSGTVGKAINDTLANASLIPAVV